MKCVVWVVLVQTLATTHNVSKLDVLCAEDKKRDVSVAAALVRRNVQPTRTVYHNLVLFLVVDHDLKATLSREN